MRLKAELIDEGWRHDDFPALPNSTPFHDARWDVINNKAWLVKAGSEEVERGVVARPGYRPESHGLNPCPGANPAWVIPEAEQIYQKALRVTFEHDMATPPGPMFFENSPGRPLGTQVPTAVFANAARTWANLGLDLARLEQRQPWAVAMAIVVTGAARRGIDQAHDMGKVEARSIAYPQHVHAKLLALRLLMPWKMIRVLSDSVTVVLAAWVAVPAMALALAMARAASPAP